MRISVLDHGYVEFIEAWGAGTRQDFRMWHDGSPDYECGIIEAARQSTQGSFRGWERGECTCTAGRLTGKPDPPGTPLHLRTDTEFHEKTCPYITQPGDAKLLEFLYSHKHFTPFEFSGMVVEVQAPIFVFREWHRHRTQSYNEMSARYAPLPDLYYLPSRDRLFHSTAGNKQAQGMTKLRDEVADVWLSSLKEAYHDAERVYQGSLADGVPKELARLIMPVGHYSRMRASANLRNWLQFMTLRCDPQAQWEIRQFALAVGDVLNKTFPKTFALWCQEFGETKFIT